MVETVVTFVMAKLGELIVKEAQFLGAVGGKVKWVETELTRIKCYLMDADSKRCKGDARAENWLNELRNVAYRIEDVIDTFYVEIEDKRHKDHNFKERLKRLGFKTIKLFALHKLGTELDDIKKVLEGIFESTRHYQINPLQERSKEETVPMPHRRATYQDVDEIEVVGLDTDKKNVCKLLLDSKIRRRSVVTIVGPGGLGKTTLAHMVYNSVQADFDFHIMLPVSQQYNPTSLLRKMLTKLKGFEPPPTLEIDDLISELKGLLSSKRYLIILDDVWVTDLWNQYLKDVLPDVENGSRVLMTSRLIEVAQSAEPIMKSYVLEFLNEEDSRSLLIKKAFPYQKHGEKCPNDLLELVDPLSKKCKGLPLALVVLGGILLTKDQTYAAWEKELRTMDWHSDGKDCTNILAISYENMPYYLKTCFLYLASFPEDDEISARRLIKMWVAEGFLPRKERKTIEEIAENCLEQLFQRSMVQVSSRHVDGSIKYCRVHDILRDFAMHQAGKENFVTVFTANPQDTNHRDRATRRASLQSCDHQFMEYVGPKTRSLFLFDLKSDLYDFSEFRLLRVLVIVSSGHGRGLIELRGVDRLIHLKYLEVRNYLTDSSECSFGRLKNLETLNFQRSQWISTFYCERNQRWISNLQTDLWTITALRHVISDLLYEAPSTADLGNLQTLEWIPFNNKPIPHLNNLRRLRLVSESIEFEWDGDHEVPHLLGGLPSLSNLTVQGENLPMEIVYPRALPNYQNLQILSLIGKWPESVTLKVSLFPPHLIKLTLDSSNLGEDPMPELGKLNNLKKLILGGGVYKGIQMICPAGFPVLQSLVLFIFAYDVEVFKVAKGVMPKLKDLKKYGIGNSIKLEMPPELMHINLREQRFY
ncbi:hypothetical protein LUZ63_013127 [Rhynchospora breviuscula]|uniref:Uncharacterized protein n=1 Tax=Rhynchospora breviuscula TaxID=2022672 RepID=A0A9Q0C854_9POAL|nr:hypothetical protein LUZ63_013127 [Rhynchospora breviuscula]